MALVLPIHRPGAPSRAGCAFDCVQVRVPATEVNGAVLGDNRRGMNPGANSENPAGSARRSIERVKISVVRPDIDRAVSGERCGGNNLAAGGEHPSLRPVGIDRVKLAVKGTKIDRPL